MFTLPFFDPSMFTAAMPAVAPAAVVPPPTPAPPPPVAAPPPVASQVPNYAGPDAGMPEAPFQAAQPPAPGATPGAEKLPWEPKTEMPAHQQAISRANQQGAYPQQQQQRVGKQIQQAMQKAQQSGQQKRPPPQPSGNAPTTEAQRRAQSQGGSLDIGGRAPGFAEIASMEGQPLPWNMQKLF